MLFGTNKIKKTSPSLGKFFLFIDIMSKVKKENVIKGLQEKMNCRGVESLTNAELITILIHPGGYAESLNCAEELLLSYENSLNMLFASTERDLEKYSKLGERKATILKCCSTLYNRTINESSTKRIQILNSMDAAKLLSGYLRNLKHEECWVVFLDRHNQTISKERISIGGVCATVVDIKIVMKKAIERLASSIILFHNHPSGSIIPGEEDKKLTLNLKRACNVLNIELADHIIIGGGNYYSFNDNGFQ